MSNNKSRLLDRKTGRQNIGAPAKAFENRLESNEEDLQFIRLVTTGKSDDEVIKQFLLLLSQFRTNSDLLSRITNRTNLKRDEVIKKLAFYARKYTDRLELEALFGRNRW